METRKNSRAHPTRRSGADIGSMVLKVLAVQIQAFSILRAGLDPLRRWVRELLGDQGSRQMVMLSHGASGGCKRDLDG